MKTITFQLRGAPKSKRPASRKRKENRGTWSYEPAVDDASTYWDVGMEGKRRRTMCTASYRDEDARSDSNDDPEDLFKPHKDDESSSSEDSANEPIGKKNVPLPPCPPHFIPKK